MNRHNKDQECCLMFDPEPWKECAMPLVVLLSMVMGGLIIPDTSIATEKEKKTITRKNGTVGEIISEVCIGLALTAAIIYLVGRRAKDPVKQAS